MDWAEDKIGYPDFNTKIRKLGSPYIHDEWRLLIDVIFTSSNPSNEDSWPPSALVEEAMRIHNVRFATSAVLYSVSASQPIPSQSAVQCPSGKAHQPSMHRKMDVCRFLNLTAEDEEEDEDGDGEDRCDGNIKEGEGDDISEVRGSVRHSINPGPSGKETFNQAVDSMMAQYSRKSQPQDVQAWKSLQIMEGVPIPLPKKLFIIDLFSGVFTSSDSINSISHLFFHSKCTKLCARIREVKGC